jgi:hypothetical protein
MVRETDLEAAARGHTFMFDYADTVVHPAA